MNFILVISKSIPDTGINEVTCVLLETQLSLQIIVSDFNFYLYRRKMFYHHKIFGCDFNPITRANGYYVVSNGIKMMDAF